ncbi:hemolysin III family protein [Clostridiaceae bacterium NSJ-31]|uniref:Hemolysin III family protein n=1 Tax=Ligaoa zhengdingensis TaxID=2763658 RepID=A0A926E0Y3_9FIRM|nr:hemolysin III family protein [Ligaoa zhengdingensis]MBC8547049.1 hemolysin III family protein [Ligaoa zhengdingensis]
MSYYMKKARDPISSATHLWGAIISVVGLAMLLTKTLRLPEFSLMKVLSSALFGLSLIALYTASSVYHFSNAGSKKVTVLRKLDHAMIYVLIAGTYTPVMLNLLPYPRNVAFTVFIWAFAAVGIVLKLCWFGAPRWLQTTLYLVMGWAILFDATVFARMSAGALAWLIAGGVSYTAGGVIYMLKKPNISERFGFHELFHIFVLIGSLCHFLLVYLYIA